MKSTTSLAYWSLLMFAATLALPAVAQTWQKQGKVTMSVATFEGPCNTATDSMALSSDRSQLLTCQSGTWKLIKAAIPTCGQFCALAGKTATCNYGYWAASAKVLSDGTVQMRGSTSRYEVTQAYGQRLISREWSAYATAQSVTADAYADQADVGGLADQYMGWVTFTAYSAGISANNTSCGSWN